MEKLGGLDGRKKLGVRQWFEHANLASYEVGRPTIRRVGGQAGPKLTAPPVPVAAGYILNSIAVVYAATSHVSLLRFFPVHLRSCFLDLVSWCQPPARQAFSFLTLNFSTVRKFDISGQRSLITNG